MNTNQDGFGYLGAPGQSQQPVNGAHNCPNQASSMQPFHSNPPNQYQFANANPNAAAVQRNSCPPRAPVGRNMHPGIRSQPPFESRQARGQPYLNRNDGLPNSLQVPRMQEVRHNQMNVISNQVQSQGQSYLPNDGLGFVNQPQVALSHQSLRPLNQVAHISHQPSNVPNSQMQNQVGLNLHVNQQHCAPHLPQPQPGLHLANCFNNNAINYCNNSPQIHQQNFGNNYFIHNLDQGAQNQVQRPSHLHHQQAPFSQLPNQPVVYSSNNHIGCHSAFQNHNSGWMQQFQHDPPLFANGHQDHRRFYQPRNDNFNAFQNKIREVQKIIGEREQQIQQWRHQLRAQALPQGNNRQGLGPGGANRGEGSHQVALDPEEENLEFMETDEYQSLSVLPVQQNYGSHQVEQRESQRVQPQNIAPRVSQSHQIVQNDQRSPPQIEENEQQIVEKEDPNKEVINDKQHIDALLFNKQPSNFSNFFSNNPSRGSSQNELNAGDYNPLMSSRQIFDVKKKIKTIQRELIQEQVNKRRLSSGSVPCLAQKRASDDLPSLHALIKQAADSPDQKKQSQSLKFDRSYFGQLNVICNQNNSASKSSSSGRIKQRSLARGQAVIRAESQQFSSVAAAMIQAQKNQQQQVVRRSQSSNVGRVLNSLQADENIHMIREESNESQSKNQQISKKSAEIKRSKNNDQVKKGSASDIQREDRSLNSIKDIENMSFNDQSSNMSKSQLGRKKSGICKQGSGSQVKVSRSIKSLNQQASRKDISVSVNQVEGNLHGSSNNAKHEEQKSVDKIHQPKMETEDRKPQSSPFYNRVAGSICIKNSAYIEASDMDDQQFQDEVIKRRVSSQNKQFSMIDQFIKEQAANQNESDDQIGSESISNNESHNQESYNYKSHTSGITSKKNAYESQPDKDNNSGNEGAFYQSLSDEIEIKVKGRAMTYNEQVEESRKIQIDQVDNSNQIVDGNHQQEKVEPAGPNLDIPSHQKQHLRQKRESLGCVHHPNLFPEQWRMHGMRKRGSISSCHINMRKKNFILDNNQSDQHSFIQNAVRIEKQDMQQRANSNDLQMDNLIEYQKSVSKYVSDRMSDAYLFNLQSSGNNKFGKSPVSFFDSDCSRQFINTNWFDKPNVLSYPIVSRVMNSYGAVESTLVQYIYRLGPSSFQPWIKSFMLITLVPASMKLPKVSVRLNRLSHLQQFLSESLYINQMKVQTNQRFVIGFKLGIFYNILPKFALYYNVWLKKYYNLSQQKQREQNIDNLSNDELMLPDEEAAIPEWRYRHFFFEQSNLFLEADKISAIQKMVFPQQSKQRDQLKQQSADCLIHGSQEKNIFQLLHGNDSNQQSSQDQSQNNISGDFGYNIQRRLSFDRDELIDCQDYMIPSKKFVHIGYSINSEEQSQSDHYKECKRGQIVQEGKTDNLTLEMILEGRTDVWSFIDDNYKDVDEKVREQLKAEKERKINEFRRISSKKCTLVFELVDLFLEVFDPKKSKVPVNQWQNVHQVYCKVKDKMYLFTYKANLFELSIWLELLAKDYELIIYSFLPKQLLMAILNQIDKSSQHISHVLSYDEITFLDGYVVRDMTFLKQGRKLRRFNKTSNIYLVQTSEDCQADHTLSDFCIWAAKYTQQKKVTGSDGLAENSNRGQINSQASQPQSCQIGRGKFEYSNVQEMMHDLKQLKSYHLYCYKQVLQSKGLLH